MLAMRLPTILPSPDQAEMLEVTKIYSISGKLKKGQGIMKTRPFVSVHHTATAAALAGGGSVPRPGACSLAHRGVLFLDEFPEFTRAALEALRQPMEDRCVSIARAGGSYTYPADFLLCAAMNPCRCGYYPDRERCRCSEEDVRRYLGKISGPMLDRMDICTEASRMEYAELKEVAGEHGAQTSADIRKRVEQAFMIQKERYEGTALRFNRDIGVKEIERYCRLTPGGEKLMRKAYEELGLSARAFHRILKVARTIADLEGSAAIKDEHLAEAIGFRSLDRRYWNG
jgi:magnesium chelatase family protein